MDHQYIKLNTNENPYPPSQRVLDAIQDAARQGLNLYPDPQSKALCQAIADFYGLIPDQVFVGNGSDEILAHAFKAFFSGKQFIQFPRISYSFYPVYCKLFDINYQLLELEQDFSLNLQRFSTEASGVVFANPNAPTGHAVSRADIRRMLCSMPDTVVIVDEAYVDFGAESAVELIASHPNLLVVQTFSKSRSLAGMRVGFALGQPSLIEALVRVKDSFNSYPLDRLAQVAACEAVKDAAWLQETTGRVMATRDFTLRSLRDLGFEVIPSCTNFVFARFPGASGESLYQGLKKQGILVRHFAKPGISDYLRITIGTDSEMQSLLEALPGVLANV